MNARSIYQILSGLSLGGVGFGAADENTLVVALCAAAVPMFMLMKSQCPCEVTELNEELNERDRMERENQLYSLIHETTDDLYARIAEVETEMHNGNK